MGWSLLCLLWSHVIDTHYGRGGDWRKMPSFLLQTIICRFAPLFGQKGRHMTCLGICPCGGHRRTWMSPIAVYPSLLRQSLSLVLELTVSSGRLAGHQGPASLHLSGRHTVVTPCCCTCRLVAEPRSPGLHTHALACQSFSLPSCLLLNHIFFSNLNLSTTSLPSNRLPTSPYILMELFSLSLKFCILYGRN